MTDATVYGFTSDVCTDLMKVRRSYLQGKLTPPGTLPDSHPWGGSAKTYMLLAPLGPATSAASIGGDTFSALALALVPAKRPVQVIRRTGSASFTLKYGSSTTASLTGDSTAMQTALNGAGATCVVFGDGIVVHEDPNNPDESGTTTIAANTWFVVFSEGGSAPTLITSVSTKIKTAWSRWEPVDIVEEVFIGTQIDPSLTMPAGAVLQAIPLPGLGQVALPPAVPVIIKYIQTTATCIAGSMTSPQTFTADVWEKNRSGSPPYPLQRTSDTKLQGITVVNYDPSQSGTSGLFGIIFWDGDAWVCFWLGCHT